MLLMSLITPYLVNYIETDRVTEIIDDGFMHRPEGADRLSLQRRLTKFNPNKLANVRRLSWKFPSNFMSFP